MARRSRNEWHIEAVVARTAKETEQRVRKAAILVRDEVKRSLNTSNASGSNPSKEGEPPHKVSGRLQQSIVEDVTVEGGSVVGRVGTNVESARRLEQGFHGTDSAGRVIAQGPRPFLRPGLFNNLERVRAILGAKK